MGGVYFWPIGKLFETRIISVFSLFQTLKRKPEFFPQFFQKVLEGSLSDDPKISILEHTSLIVFLTHCFNSMEEFLVRDETKKLTSLLMWMSLQEVYSVCFTHKYHRYILLFFVFFY